MAISYNTGIPTASQRLKDSQSQIQTNFDGINALVAINHETFSSTDAGKHKFLQLTKQTSSPSIGTTEAGVYTKAVSGAPALFIKTGSSTEIDITTQTAASSSGVTTRTFAIAAGFTVKVGYTTGSKLTIDAATTITFPAAFSSSCYTVVATPLLNNATTGPSPLLRIVSYTTTGFTVFVRKGTGSATNIDCTFIAYGA